jgi:predicted TPR repeat methyltransferase
MADIAQALTEAVALHRAGQTDRAEQAYRQILEAEPECADAWHLLGVLACQTGRPYPACGYIGHAIGLNPDASSYHNSLGAAYRALKRRDDALACYRRALDLKPDYPEAHNNLGVLSRELGNFDEAAASYRRAVELKADYAEAYSNLGIVLTEQGKTADALAAFEKSLDIKHDFPEAINNMGLALFTQRKFDDAIACARRALALKPNYAEAHKALGDALREQGKLDEAATHYQRAVEEKPDYTEALNTLGIVLMKRGDLDEAAAHLERALELNPVFLEAHNNLGIVYKMQGKIPAAIASYRRALELLPDYAEAHNNLANALLEQDHAEEAETHWRRALELKPELADAYGNLAMMLYEKGRIAEAAAILKDWLAIAPDNPVARHMAASFSGEHTPDRADDGFIRYSFDHFARTFEEKLKRLEYRAPDLVADAVRKAFGEPTGTLDVIDAGCGTGWCGPLLKPYARRLIGVDLSPAMLEKARERNVYDELVEAELTAYFEAAAADSCDLIASADTLVYFGDLQPITAAAAKSLRPGGHFIFTIEKAADGLADENGFFLQPHGRYCHAEAYARRIVHQAGLEIQELTPCVLRMELGKPVNGMLVSSRK